MKIERIKEHGNISAYLAGIKLPKFLYMHKDGYIELHWSIFFVWKIVNKLGFYPAFQVVSKTDDE